MTKWFRILFIVLAITIVDGVELKSTKALTEASANSFVELTKQPENLFVVSCSPDRPTLFRKESVNIRVWTRSSNLRSLEYIWTVTGGVIEGEGNRVTWTLEGVIHGIHVAHVKVVSKEDGIRECIVRIAVKEPMKAFKRQTGWSFLTRDNSETKGYGLYSYILLGSPPTEANWDRFVKVIDSYLLHIPSIIEFENELKIPRSEININYLPITSDPPDYEIDVEWILEHYDYARARVLLRILEGDNRDGPYIISSIKPLTGLSELSGNYLYQNLSLVPSHVVHIWAREFFNQAAQEQYWKPRTAKQFAIKLRTTIAILAKALPVVRESVDYWIEWIG